MVVFTYLFILLFIIIFILYLLKKSLKICPPKIKKFYTITFVILIIRYIALIFGQTIQVQRYIYMIKSWVLLNYCAVPLLALAAIYIFLRVEKRTFDYNFVFMILIALTFIGLVYVYKVNISIDIVFGFIVNFKSYLTPSLIYLIMLASLAVIALLSIDRPYSNRGGMVLLTVSLMLMIIEFIMELDNIKIFPYPLFGEIMMLITTYKAIRTFEKKH